MIKLVPGTLTVRVVALFARYANQIQPSNDQNMQELLNMLLSSEALSGNSQQQTQRIDKNTMQLRQKLYDLLFSDEDIVRSAQTDSLQTFPFFQPFPPFPLPRLPWKQRNCMKVKVGFILLHSVFLWRKAVVCCKSNCNCSEQIVIPVNLAGIFIMYGFCPWVSMGDLRYVATNLVTK